MRTEVITADTIDAAAERILLELKEEDTNTARVNNVIYFDGWDGLGASAVLRAVASKATAGLQFDKVIHIDCSKWENRRAVQRAIVEQLDFPVEVLETFDRQEEDDDYHGIPEGSRTEIKQVLRTMHLQIQKLSRRQLVIFHNGSNEEMDFATFGFPLYGYSNTKMLWTFQGRFRLNPRMKVDRAIMNSTTTHVFFSATHSAKDPHELWSVLVSKEATEVSGMINIPGIVEATTDCFIYMLKLSCMAGSHLIDYDLLTHGCNCWVSDGGLMKLQQEEGDDEIWRVADALQREMRLDLENFGLTYQHWSLMTCAESMPYWYSPPYMLVPAGGVLNGDTFQHFNKLGVLKFSRCTFSFSSPPFLCCNNLRFLWLEHCKDQTINTDGVASKKEDILLFFQRLWVLDVRYTCCDQILSAEILDLLNQLKELNVMGAQDLDMSQLQGRLPNIRKLRITKSTINFNSSPSENDDLFSGMMKKMEHLEFSGNRIMNSGLRSLSMAASRSLQVETVIIDEGCVGLEKISCSGCANLRNVLLSGSFEELKSIDISGTAVKTLDLSSVAAKELDEVTAIDCGKLCAILWPHEGKRKQDLSKLRIKTTTEGGSSNATEGSSSLSVKYGSRAPREYNWYVSVTDARLLWSLVALEMQVKKISVHMEVSSPPGCAYVWGNKEESRIINHARQHQPEITTLVYRDVTVTFTDDDDAPTITQIWPCPGPPDMDARDSYVYIQDQPMRRTRLELGSSREVISTSYRSITLPDVIFNRALIMHVHDSKFITCVPVPFQDTRWDALLWCRVERCPSLDCVFLCPQVTASGETFFCPQTVWCSELPKVRCIWKMKMKSSLHFKDIRFIHADLCPRLTHVLPVSNTMIHDDNCLGRLETLDIVWCGDLRVLFPSSDKSDAERNQQISLDQQEHAATNNIVVIKFLSLKHMHLHELPKLHDICGSGARMYAPNLESIKVRGCFSLTRLPAVRGGNYKKKVACDCEKEWWDKLKWDGVHANHAPSLYNPSHPRHSKKTLLKTSVLR